MPSSSLPPIHEMYPAAWPPPEPASREQAPPIKLNYNDLPEDQAGPHDINPRGPKIILSLPNQAEPRTWYEMPALAKMTAFRDICPPKAPITNNPRAPVIAVEGSHSHATAYVAGKLKDYLRSRGNHVMFASNLCSRPSTEAKDYVGYMKAISKWKDKVQPLVEQPLEQPIVPSNAPRIFLHVDAQLHLIDVFSRGRLIKYYSTLPAGTTPKDYMRGDSQWKSMAKEWAGVAGPDLLIYVENGSTRPEGDTQLRGDRRMFVVATNRTAGMAPLSDLLCDQAGRLVDHFLQAFASDCAL